MLTPSFCFSSSPDITFRTVFWSMLGRGEPQAVELDGYNNMFTQNVGYWIFGVYNVAVVIVLLNMLIAMMSRSFEIIQVIIVTCRCRRRRKLTELDVEEVFVCVCRVGVGCVWGGGGRGQ